MTLRELVADVGRLLGRWKLEPGQDFDGDRRAVLVGPSGARLLFSTTLRPGRLYVAGLLPSGIEPTRRIWITRTPAVLMNDLACDVRRLLLPVYLPELERAQAKVQQELATVAAVDATLRSFEQLAGDGRLVARRYEAERTRLRFPGEAWGTAQVTRSMSVTIELHDLTPEQARLVVEALARGHLPMWRTG